MQLTVTVITRNEAANIEGALESVKWADEIVVVDSHSTDDTAAIARRFTRRIEVRDWPGYSAQRNYAAEIASYDWILAIDADERVPQELASEIQAILREGTAEGGYRMPRVSHYLGRWIRGTDWYPDYQLRLYDRRVGRWNGKRVHESVELLEGRPATLRNDLQHYPYRDISDHVTSIDHYTTLAAEEWHAEHRRTSVFEMAIHPPAAFIRNYILRGGFRDGASGFLISVLNSYYVFLKLLKLWELQQSSVASRQSPVDSPSRPSQSTVERRRKFERTPNDTRATTPDPSTPRPLDKLGVALSPAEGQQAQGRPEPSGGATGSGSPRATSTVRPGSPSTLSSPNGSRGESRTPR